jgi:hypothetical protein
MIVPGSIVKVAPEVTVILPPKIQTFFASQVVFVVIFEVTITSVITFATSTTAVAVEILFSESVTVNMIAPAPTAEVVKFTSTVEPLTLPVGFETVTFVPTALYVVVSFESTDTLKITFPV